MKKRVSGRQFSRNKNQRKALFRGLIVSLVEKGELITTLSKAKAIKSQAEKLVTRAKNGTLADRRIIHRFLPKNELVNRLVEGIAPLFKDRKGGYLRIVKLGYREGDQTQMAKLSFVIDQNQIIEKPKKEKPAKVEVKEPVKVEEVKPVVKKERTIKKTK